MKLCEGVKEKHILIASTLIVESGPGRSLADVHDSARDLIVSVIMPLTNLQSLDIDIQTLDGDQPSRIVAVDELVKCVYDEAVVKRVYSEGTEIGLWSETANVGATLTQTVVLSDHARCHEVRDCT